MPTESAPLDLADFFGHESIDSDDEFEVVLVPNDPLRLPRYTLELGSKMDAIFYPDEAGRPKIKNLAFAGYLEIYFKPVTYRGKTYVYNIDTGLYREHSGEIPARVQEICDAGGYGGKIIGLKNEMMSRMADRKCLTESPFDKVPGIPVQNCLVQIGPESEIERAPYDPDLFVTCRSSTPFDPADFELSFPEGEKFFAEISLGNEKWVSDLFLILGYAFILGNPNQKYFVFYGTGGNGKGVLVEWILQAFGDLAARVSSREFLSGNISQRETSIARNLHRRVMIASELGSGKLNDDLLKRLTGDSAVSLNAIYVGEETYAVNATPILVTNLLPQFESGGTAMVRRQVAVPFLRNVPKSEQDPELLERLATPEGNRWLQAQVISGWLRYAAAERKANLWDELCPVICEGTAESVELQDPVGAFLHAELVAEPGARTPGRLVFERWYTSEFGEVQSLHERAGGRGLKVNLDVGKFYDGLRAHGVEIKRNFRVNGKMESNVVMNWRLKSEV